MKFIQNILAYFKRLFGRKPVEAPKTDVVQFTTPAPQPAEKDAATVKHDRFKARLAKWMKRHPHGTRLAKTDGIFLQVRHFGTFSPLKPLSTKRDVSNGNIIYNKRLKGDLPTRQEGRRRKAA